MILKNVMFGAATCENMKILKQRSLLTLYDIIAKLLEIMVLGIKF